MYKLLRDDFSPYFQCMDCMYFMLSRYITPFLFSWWCWWWRLAFLMLMTATLWRIWNNPCWWWYHIWYTFFKLVEKFFLSVITITGIFFCLFLLWVLFSNHFWWFSFRSWLQKNVFYWRIKRNIFHCSWSKRIYQ